MTNYASIIDELAAARTDEKREQEAAALAALYRKLDDTTAAVAPLLRVIDAVVAAHPDSLYYFKASHLTVHWEIKARATYAAESRKFRIWVPGHVYLSPVGQFDAITTSDQGWHAPVEKVDTLIPQLVSRLADMLRHR